MKYRIKNEKLSVEVQTAGGSLCSIRDVAGTEYLWQGDPAYWEEQAPNLFPYVARMTEGKYILDETVYEMGIHGFVRTSELQAAELTEDSLVVSLEDSEETRKQYPYRFRYEIEYRLAGSQLQVAYHVYNRDTKTMYFGLGGHPGFRVPLEEGLAFEDYYIQFPAGSSMRKVGLTPDCFINGETEAFPLEKGDILPLRHSLFDDDAIVLCEMPKEVSLLAGPGRKGVRVSYPQMNYLGLWHKPLSDAPYVCIEPWLSLPSRKGRIEDLAEQPDLAALEPGGHYCNRWTIEIL